ncbi:hypothetical protein QQF64_016214 [Cirrhinus molitorella]|uniref:Uncharacterized protein n=1 Tax=Cirrhinus molitorella TaxID=172907 RepID=A0ABR3LM62_9TELE
MKKPQQPQMKGSGVPGVEMKNKRVSGPCCTLQSRVGPQGGEHWREASSAPCFNGITTAYKEREGGNAAPLLSRPPSGFELLNKMMP